MTSPSPAGHRADRGRVRGRRTAAAILAVCLGLGACGGSTASPPSRSEAASASAARPSPSPPTSPSAASTLLPATPSASAAASPILLGDSWTPAADVPTILEPQLSGIAVDDAGWIAVGSYGAAVTGRLLVLTSRDGEHWSQVDEGQLFSAPELGPVRVAASPTARVAIGSFPNGTGAIWRASADGRWTRPTFPDQRASVVDDIATDATRFLIVGAIDPGTARARGAAWSSSDGLTWRLATFPSGVFPSALAWTGTDFIATGLLRNAAVYWRTRDGVAWSTPQRLPGDAIPARPAAGPEGILIPATLATSSGAWLSADGKTWALEPLPDRLMPFDALAVGGTFMVSGRIDLGAGAGEILVRGSASDPWRPASVAAGFEAPLRLGASPVRLAASPDGRMVIGVDGGVILISEGR